MDAREYRFLNVTDDQIAFDNDMKSWLAGVREKRRLRALTVGIAGVNALLAAVLLLKIKLERR